MTEPAGCPSCRVLAGKLGAALKAVVGLSRIAAQPGAALVDPHNVDEILKQTAREAVELARANKGDMP